VNFNNDGMMFSTPENDNDMCPCNCANDRGHGWWFNWCSISSLNFDGTAFWETSVVVQDVQASRMLVKRN